MSLGLTDLSDESVFESVFHELYAPLAGFALKYVNDSDVAEEIVQDTFTSVWVKVNQIQIQTTVKSYLYGAVRNACLNYLKHNQIIHVHQQYVKRQGVQTDAIDFLELEELQSKVDDALRKVPEKCRQIFMLNRFEGKKYREIADELDISIKTVENQMGKALKIMKQELQQYLPAIVIILLLNGGKF
ncbi:MAG: RNA polymerase sigma-70 factor [Cyclobacteriaceae bacterium]